MVEIEYTYFTSKCALHSISFILFHCSSVSWVCFFWLRICTYVCPLTFLFTFFNCFFEQFYTWELTSFSYVQFLSPTLKFDLNFLMIFRKISASFPHAFHPDAGPAELKVESPPITTAAFKQVQRSVTIRKTRILIDLNHVNIYFCALRQHKT